MGKSLKRDIEYFIFKKRPIFGADMAGGGDGDDDDGGDGGPNPELRYRKWLSKETMILDKSNGGLKVPNWDAQVGAMQAQWVIRYLSPEERPWRHLLDYYLLATAGPRGRLELFSTLPLAPILARLTPSDLPPAVAGDPPITSMRGRKAASHPILHFWRTAITQFRHLKWEEEVNRLDSHVLADSVFDSPTLVGGANTKKKIRDSESSADEPTDAQPRSP